MTSITLDEFRADVNRYLAEAAEDRVVLTRDGKPYIVLLAVPEDQEAGFLDTEYPPEFWQMIRERRKEEAFPWDEAVKTLGLAE